ncbi:MAG TPA: cysteine methyltransferase [Alcanivorax sp.]|nr:cysteine methyltransferase [Alcanivorax sp.]
MNQEFTDAVYQIVGAIPAGRVASYGQVARQAGYPRHARFVGRLMSRLPEGSALPWHRVIRGDGGLPLAGTPSGEIQIQRLSDEGVTVLGNRVPKSCFWQRSRAAVSSRRRNHQIVSRMAGTPSSAA